MIAIRECKIKMTYFIGDMTSKQNLRSDSLTGRTLHIRKSSSIIVGTSSLSRLLKSTKINSKLSKQIKITRVIYIGTYT